MHEKAIIRKNLHGSRCLSFVDDLHCGQPALTKATANVVARI